MAKERKVKTPSDRGEKVKKLLRIANRKHHYDNIDLELLETDTGFDLVLWVYAEEDVEEEYSREDFTILSDVDKAGLKAFAKTLDDAANDFGKP